MLKTFSEVDHIVSDDNSKSKEKDKKSKMSYGKALSSIENGKLCLVTCLWFTKDEFFFYNPKPIYQSSIGFRNHPTEAQGIVHAKPTNSSNSDQM